jgi:hypothetical protein
MRTCLIVVMLALGALGAPSRVAVPAFAAERIAHGTALCRCRCGIDLQAPCGPADCMRVCGYDAAPPPQQHPDVERFDRDRAQLAAELESVREALDETSGDLARATRRHSDLETRLGKAQEEQGRLSAAQDEVTRLERETGVDPVTSEVQIQQRATALAQVGAMAEATADRVWDNVKARRSLIDHALRGICRALAVDVRAIRLLADPSGIGRRMLDRLVPPPARAAQEPARALTPPAEALMPPAQAYAIPPLPAEGSLDWAALQRLRAVIAELRADLGSQQSRLRRLRQDVAAKNAALAAIDLRQVRDDTRAVEQRGRALRALSDAVQGVKMPIARAAEHLEDVGATVVVEIAGRVRGAPEELWVTVNQRLTRLADTTSGAWELPAGVRLKTPSSREVIRWTVGQAAGRVSREALSRMPPIPGQVARVEGFGRFYRNQVERIVNDASRIMTDAARAGAYGSVDEMQTVADRAQLPAIAVERDTLARLTRAPLSWFVEVDGDPKR